MAKRKGYRPASTTREKPPLFRNDNGNVQILCPWCPQPHPIYPHKPSDCGTVLQVSAVQTVYPERTLRKAGGVVCIRCGKEGGEMVSYGLGFVHTVDCNPERVLLAAPPTYSEWARRVYNMPKWLRLSLQWLIRRPVVQVNEVDEHGQETGKVLGYYFGAPRVNYQGKHPQTGARQPVP